MNFFLLGMPRSRTLWLSYLLSFGNSYCFHESLSNKDSLMARRIPKIFGFDNVGSADTYPLGFNGDLVGKSPLVLIDRDLDDVKYSLEISFNYSPEKDPNGVLDSMYEKLQTIETENSMRINFSDLNDVNNITELMKFCNVRVDQHHINKMLSSRIIVDNCDLVNSQHALNEYME